MIRSAARGLQEKCTRAAKKKNPRGLQRKLGKREVGKPGIECIQKLSYHAVDWFLVSPGLTLRGSRSSCDSQTGGFFFFPFSIWEHPAVLGPPPEPGTEEAGSSNCFFSYFRASSSHLNSFVKLSLASSQPFFLPRGACRVCACGREPEREREREREREQTVDLNVRGLPRMVCSVAVSHSHHRSRSAAFRWTFGGGRRTV